MKHAMYDELVPWYHLIDPLEAHAEEATLYAAALQLATAHPARTLLELGAGAGNNVFFLKRAFQCTATDLSAEMLALSAELNPDCAHHQGDMRTLRLHETFAECADTTAPRQGGERALMMSEWVWDPDPEDTTYRVDYTFLLREGGEMRAVHDHHVEGLFSKETWLEVLSSVGYAVEILRRPLGYVEEGYGYTEEIFLCRRPV